MLRRGVSEKMSICVGIVVFTRQRYSQSPIIRLPPTPMLCRRHETSVRLAQAAYITACLYPRTIMTPNTAIVGIVLTL